MAGLDDGQKIAVNRDVATEPSGEIGGRRRECLFDLPSITIPTPRFRPPGQWRGRRGIGHADEEPVAGEGQSPTKLIVRLMLDGWGSHFNLSSIGRRSPDLTGKGADVKAVAEARETGAVVGQSGDVERGEGRRGRCRIRTMDDAVA